MRILPVVIHYLFFILLNVLSISKTQAAENLFYIVKKADWLANATKSSYCPPTFSKQGFVVLFTPEQVIPAACTLFQGETDLLLLKISVSAADPLLKWETVPGSDVSYPHYYGELPRILIRKIYLFKPQRDGSFVLPNDPLTKRMTTRLMPKGLVNKFLSYQNWQKTERFRRLQIRNFEGSKVRLQWWYFDFLLHDGSSVVLAFIPQHWWDDVAAANERKSVFTISLKTKQGHVKRFTTSIPQSEIKTSASHLEIPSRLLIRAVGSGDDNQYSIQVNFPEVTGVFTIRPTQPPFAAFPTGVMPGVLQTALRGVPLGSPNFSYVSQIPNSRVSGSLAWGTYQTKIEGQAYHEQGRLNDTPARQGGGWFWYHFAGDGWNIFGTPGSYIYLQQGNRIIRSGFHLIPKNYTLQNRTYASPDHVKILTGGAISFRHEDVAFQLTINPLTSKTLVCFPSADPNQVWGTVEGAATLSISEGSTTKLIDGRMFLETCSWEASTKSKANKPLEPDSTTKGILTNRVESSDLKKLIR